MSSSAFVDLASSIDLRQSTALNVLDGSTEALRGIIGPEASGTGILSSDPDVDAQVLLSVAFQNAVKLHSIAIKADVNPPENGSGPATVHVFIGKPNLDFSEAQSSSPVQTLHGSTRRDILLGVSDCLCARSD